MSYYHVEAKMGHVGKGRYFKGNLYIWAENGREAATKARNCPRVKHDRKDAIISVRAISEDEYMKGREENENWDISDAAAYRSRGNVMTK